MKLIKGNQLNEAQKRHVKAAFVHRLTKENGYPARNPCKARVPAISDEQWIAKHAFWFKDNGEPTMARIHAEPVYMAD